MTHSPTLTLTLAPSGQLAVRTTLRGGEISDLPLPPGGAERLLLAMLRQQGKNAEHAKVAGQSLFDGSSAARALAEFLATGRQAQKFDAEGKATTTEKSAEELGL